MKDIRVEIAATDGTKICRLAWLVNIKGKGIYSGFSITADLHFSYHLDGKVHTKATKIRLPSHNEKGYASCGLNGPPLDDFKGYYTLMQGGLTLDGDYFNKKISYEFKKIDRLILLDSRSISSKPKIVHLYFDLLEANNYEVLNNRMREMQSFSGSDGKSICEHHCYFEQSPWLVVHIAYQSKRIL